jgi:hypothetical protein
VDIIRSEGDDDYCVALQAVATHELGHWLGLPDERSSENRDSIMYWARSKDGPFKLNLTVGDIRNLCVMYDCVVWP